MPDFELKRRKGGIWYITGTVDGERIRRSLGTRDEKVANLKYAEAQSKLQKAAIYGVEYEALFADAAVLYLQDGKDSRFIAPIIKEIGRMRIAKIKPGTIRRVAKKLYPDATAATRNRQCISPAAAIINFGADAGICNFIRIKKFKVTEEKQPVAVDIAWHEKFIEHADSLQIAALDLLMYTTGVRISNAVRLEPEHLDLDNATALLKQTKNGSAHTLRLTDDLISMLREIEPKQVKDGSYRIFGYYCRSSIYTPWKKTCKAAGIPYIPPHQSGRHTFATEMIIRNGVDAKSTAVIGGWKSVRLLLERYVHPEGLNEQVEEVFGSVKINRSETPDNVIRLKTKRRASK